MRLKMTLFIVLAGMAFGAFAAAPLKFDDVRAQQQQIRAGVMAGTGRYKDMPEQDRQNLLKEQDQLLSILGDKTDPSQLGDDERVQAFNILESIEAAINKAEDERVVCERYQKTGTNRKVTVCRTARTMREQSERARRAMEGSAPAPWR
jgi:hypothetical protein